MLVELDRAASIEEVTIASQNEAYHVYQQQLVPLTVKLNEQLAKLSENISSQQQQCVTDQQQALAMQQQAQQMALMQQMQQMLQMQQQVPRTSGNNTVQTKQKRKTSKRESADPPRPKVVRSPDSFTP